MEGKLDDLSSVGVAVRVRPLNNTEKIEDSRVCVTVDHTEKTITMGKDRTFTFDQVYGIDSKQEEIFEGCTKELVLSVFAGYNATVLAYGQTGSGKTFTMGSGQTNNINQEEIGIIPRVIKMIFDEVDKRKNQAEFIIKVSFLEIYNEEIHDLLETNSMVPEKPISIREDKGSIFLMGLHEEKVINCEEMLTCLERGTLQRIVASTLMNASSSRSHAIFTINVEQQIIEVQPEVTEGQEYMMAKFHFVDLAGSERAKRTGASGATLKEGISINKGLLCLGNVISALTEDSQKKIHVPYRDSKLTRILQDSLGGNARTCMIACISPAEINFEETLNTLKYASRARNIKNKPVINRDPQSAIIAQLKQELSSLKQEIKSYQKILSDSGNEDIRASLELLQKDYSGPNDEELQIAKSKTTQLEKKLIQSNIEIESFKLTSMTSQLELLQLKRERDIYKAKLEKYTNVLISNGLQIDEDDKNSVSLIDEYNVSLESLKKTNESKDKLIIELQLMVENLEKNIERDTKILKKKAEQVEQLKREKKFGHNDIDNIIMKNVDDYGRIFAETIMAKINKPENSELDECETNEEITKKKLEQEELENVEFKIQEKEEILKNIEEAFKELQSQLVEEMSNQYYKKIEELEIEKKNTEKERDLALEKIKEGSSADKQLVAEKFKSKIQYLEDKLKENKRKDKELSSLHKLVETQKVQLGKLDEEIRKAKTERIRLQKRIKEEAEELQKWKSQKQKEILLIKKKGLKKDQEIQSLKRENRNKDLIAKKKSEELAAIQKRHKEMNLRKKKGVNLDADTLNQWVQEYTAACIDEREILFSMNQEIQEKDECEKEVQELYSVFSQKSIQLEQYNLMLADNEPNIDQDELYSNTYTLKAEVQEIMDQIDMLENKIKRKIELIFGYSNALANSKIEEIKSRAFTVHTLEESQNLVGVLFDEVLSKASEIKKVNKIILSKDLEIENKEISILKAENEVELIIKKYENEINKIKNEFKIKEFAILEELDELRNLDSSKTSTELNLSPLKNRESKIKNPFDIKIEEEKAKPKFISLVKARESIKRKKNTEEEEKKYRKSLAPKIQEEDTPRSSIKYRNSEIESKNLQKWKLLSNTETKGIVYSMVTQENILYTGSSQTIKVWSLDSLTSISEMAAHTSSIKAMAISPENSVIFSSCGNLIKICDTVSLQTIGTLQAQIEDFRVLKTYNNLLYSAGKSLENGNSIFIWDLRKSNMPVFQSEASQDIFSLSISNEHFNYARKNNNICQSLSFDQDTQVFESGHSSIVTSLIRYNETLISCSKDRSIKQWGSNGNSLSSINNAHTDWVNCMENDHLQRHFYTGGKEGKIKVWRGFDSIKLVGELLGLNTSVLSLSSINGPESSVVSACNDKTFKIWKMTEDVNE